ncbi:Translocation protein S66 [Microbotryomycetes sp. JL201]|nr:Translocation protein S66 [Microbotryomycetes sp. JL201]
MVSVIVPISYLVFLFGSLAIFSRFYRKRQHGKEQEIEPWFPKHKSRDVYISLLSMDPPPARPVLVAALLRRAMDDVRMIWAVRDAKSALQVMLQKGQAGDDLWERFTHAEKELEAEIVEVVGEANTFQEGYGQHIFGLASEMVMHERSKDAYEKITARRAEEAERTAAAPPYLALSPQAYLQPTSLSLAPSHPLSEGTGRETDAIVPAKQNGHVDQKQQPAGDTGAQTPVPTTSLPEDALPVSAPAPTPATAASAEPSISDAPEATTEAPLSGQLKPSTTPVKKPVNKRKKVKGGR